MRITGTHLGILVIALYFGAQACYANDIYISQIGDNLDLDIVQDVENNQIEALSGSGKIGRASCRERV